MDVSATVGATSTGTTGSAARQGLSAVGSDDFLKLLIKQLQYQDPFKPMDNEQMLSQMAQIRNMEMSVTLTDSMRSLTEQQRFGGAAALIGKYVTGTVTAQDGTTTTLKGLVGGVRFTSKGDPILELASGDSLPLKNLTDVVDQQYVGGLTAMIGKYVTGVTKNAEGKDVAVKGTVQGVHFADDGQPVLDLDTGESLALGGVVTVSAPTSKTTAASKPLLVGLSAAASKQGVTR